MACLLHPSALLVVQTHPALSNAEMIPPVRMNGATTWLSNEIAQYYSHVLVQLQSMAMSLLLMSTLGFGPDS